MDIDVIEPGALGPALVERWRALQAMRRTWDSPFLSPDWAQAAAQCEGPAGRIRVAVWSDAAGPQGFLPVRLRGPVALPAGAPLNDYQAVIASPALRPDPAALLSALGVRRLDFTHLLADPPVFPGATRGLARAWVVDLAEGWDAYAAERRAAGTSILKDIEKRRRALEREADGLVFTPFDPDPEALAALFDWKRAQYRATRQTDVLAPSWTRDLLARLHGLTAPGFGGALFTLRAGGRVIAAQFNLVGTRTVHAWIIAHGPEFERRSPGLVLFGEILKWMTGAGYDRLDLGAGDYRFKTQLANARTDVGHGFIGRLSPESLTRGLQYRVRAVAERLPLGPASALPGKAMRRLDVLRGLR